VFLPTLITFLLVAFAWIFFRADNVPTAFYIIQHIFTGIPKVINHISNHVPLLQDYGLNNKEMLLSIFLIAFLEAVHYLQNKTNVTLILAQKPALLRWSVYYLFLISIVVYLFPILNAEKVLFKNAHLYFWTCSFMYCRFFCPRKSQQAKHALHANRQE
jgi:hypothetical protein